MHPGGFSHGIIFLVTNLRISELFLLVTRRIAENHGIIFLVPKYFFSITRRIAEGHGRQKFDNSLIRDKKEKSVTVRDTPCEEAKSVTVRDIPCEEEIRDCPRYSV